MLPEIWVEVSNLGDGVLQVAVEDNGPGIVEEQIARIFGKLLYGSKFHKLSQSRGQQGMGISAAGMYAQLTTGKPLHVLSRVQDQPTATEMFVSINTAKNRPEIHKKKRVAWDRPHGTRVEAQIEGQFHKGSHSIDIEALASRHGLTREQLRFYADSHGGSVAGELTVIDPQPETGAEIEIDCRNLGSGAYSIPHSVEHLRIHTDAKFVLAIETGGMFQRLNHHRFWKTANCILVEMGGVPTRATRRFIRRLTDDKDLPVYCFVDCDPYGFANIYRTLKAGSGNAAHINQFYSVPRARFLGVTPRDIIDFGLQDATHPLLTTDIKRANDAIKNDPFFAANPAWIAAINQLPALMSLHDLGHGQNVQRLDNFRKGGVLLEKNMGCRATPISPQADRHLQLTSSTTFDNSSPMERPTRQETSSSASGDGYVSSGFAL